MPYAWYPGLRTIGVGNRYLGLYADLWGSFKGRNCITLYAGRDPPKKGKIWGDIGFEANIGLYGMWRDERYDIGTPAEPDPVTFLDYSIEF